MFTKRRHAAIAAWALAALAASPPAARAQVATGGGGGGGDDDAARRARQAREEARVEVVVERLRRELDGLQQRQLDAMAVSSDERRDSVLRALEPAIRRAARSLALLESRLVWQHADMTASRPALAPAPRAAVAVAAPPLAPAADPQDARPRGWIGVNFSGATKITSSKSGLVIYHYDYPVVESVEPASPAERAGIEAGDTLIAYDGRDVLRRAIPLGRQLRPGAQLVLRVRRAGRSLDVPVKVERRPEALTWSYSYASPDPPSAPAPPAPPASVTPPASQRPRAPRPPAVAPGDAPGMLRLQPVPPVAPTPLASPAPGTIFGGGRPMVAGAEVTAMGRELREVFGATGVLVLSVAPGSPAAQSGLRAGDVIHRLNGAAVSSPDALRRAVQQCAADPATRSARLDVVRKKKNERMTLRW